MFCQQISESNLFAKSGVIFYQVKTFHTIYGTQENVEVVVHKRLTGQELERLTEYITRRTASYHRKGQKSVLRMYGGSKYSIEVALSLNSRKAIELDMPFLI